MKLIYCYETNETSIFAMILNDTDSLIVVNKSKNPNFTNSFIPSDFNTLPIQNKTIGKMKSYCWYDSKNLNMQLQCQKQTQYAYNNT